MLASRPKSSACLSQINQGSVKLLHLLSGASTKFYRLCSKDIRILHPHRSGEAMTTKSDYSMPKHADDGFPKNWTCNEILYNTKYFANIWCWQQIDDTVTVMKQNINKVAERGENLDNLGQQTEVLAQNSNDFNNRARGIRREMTWKNNKMKIWIGLAVLFIVLVVVIPLGMFSITPAIILCC